MGAVMNAASERTWVESALRLAASKWIPQCSELLPLNADPLEDIRNSTSIRYVVKNGVVYEGDTLTEIWPQQKMRAWLEGWHTDPDE